MPTYNPLGTKIKLVACSLANTTTVNPQRQKQRAANEIKRCEDLFLNAPTLNETHIPCFGEARRLHFLDDVPFYLIQAGGDLFKPKEPALANRVIAPTKQREDECQSTRNPATQNSQQTSRDQSGLSESQVAETEEGRQSKSTAPDGRRRTAITDEASTPQALALVITLSKDTFLRSFGERKKGQGSRQHVKYDVYFNGELAASDCQHSRYFSDKEDHTQPTIDNGRVRFISGKRVDMLVERPWVIVSQEQTAGGSLREVKRSKAVMAGAVDRWKALSEALLRRADEQGYNTKEERSPLGRYLANLAVMEMPEAVADMQKPGGHKFGVIDVVISVGQGAKGAISHYYLKQPEPLVDIKFKRMPNSWRPKSDHQPATTQQHTNRLPTMTMTAQINVVHLTTTGQSGQTPTIAASHERRNTITPINYRDTATRRSRTSTPELTSTATPERQSILPAFPAVPEIDFNDAISVTPTKAEEARMNRGFQTSSLTVNALERAQQTSGSSMSMPPPSTSIPSSSRANKHRYSDTISSPSKRGLLSTRPGAVPGSKSVSGFMGMTRRGVFGKGADACPVTPTLLAKEQAALSTVAQNKSEDPSAITRVIITSRKTPIMDKTLTLSYSFSLKSRVFQAGQDLSSQFQLLDESLVLGLKDTKSQASTAVPRLSSVQPPTQIATLTTKMQQPRLVSSPVPTLVQGIPTPTDMSPAELQQTQPTIAAQTPTPTPQSRHNTLMPSHKINYEDLLEEIRANWKTPELSKDCVISFAEECEWMTAAGNGSMFRHVRSARAGVFRESEVVFAVRYIVAGETGSTM